MTTPFYTSRVVHHFECHLECAASGGALALSVAVGASGCSSQTVSCEESQSGGVAAALQISMMAEYHEKAPPRYTLPTCVEGCGHQTRATKHPRVCSHEIR